MKVEYINPFINVASSLLTMMCSIKVERGNVFLKASPFAANHVVIIVGLAGTFKGQVYFSIDEKTACGIASKMMMGMEVPFLDEMAKSAIAELGNMILGNVCTEFSNQGIILDITPPTVMVGQDMQISTKGVETFCVPLLLEGVGTMDIDISITD